MLLLFQGGEDNVLATRMFRTYYCEDGHPMVTTLSTRRLKCVHVGCQYLGILFVLPVETVTLTAA